jgi:hypothetical protein
LDRVVWRTHRGDILAEIGADMSRFAGTPWRCLAHCYNPTYAAAFSWKSEPERM